VFFKKATLVSSFVGETVAFLEGGGEVAAGPGDEARP